MKLLSFILVMPYLSFGQILLKGNVSDKINNEPLPFVSIGIVGKSVGTLTNEKGDFELSVYENQLHDTLKIASIGYKSFSFLVSDYLKNKNKLIQMQQLPFQLEEVVIKSKKIKYKTLGTIKYTINNCTGFADIEGNWKGSEAAILIKNKKNILIESFSFYVIQNKYNDSLVFRLMFYNKIKNDWVGNTFLKKPVIFKLGIKKGEFLLNLKDYNIKTNDDFFISLECLMAEMEITKFCYSSSINTSSYYKVKAFSKWHNTKGIGAGGGGADFNVKVSYSD